MSNKTCYVLYASPTGSTKTLALAAARSLQAEIYDLAGGVCPREFKKGQAVLVAAPVFGGRIPQYVLDVLAELKGNGAAAAALVTYGNRLYEDALLELGDALSAAGFCLLGGAAFVTRHSIVPAIASGRPNQQDVAQASRFAQDLCEKAEKGDLTCPPLPGNRPYRKRSAGALHPVLTGTCEGCGICSRNCPTGAISKEDPALVDPEKCVGCMACVANCPQKARALTPEDFSAMAVKLCRLCADERSNEIFL